uniref:Uncharacterized protein n=1 Tax=Seriola lalandi dorsalis TaxID=1841481 RepID=A0A3B4W9U2_SERLL
MWNHQLKEFYHQNVNVLARTHIDSFLDWLSLTPHPRSITGVITGVIDQNWTFIDCSCTGVKRLVPKDISQCPIWEKVQVNKIRARQKRDKMSDFDKVMKTTTAKNNIIIKQEVKELQKEATKKIQFLFNC